jgi:D-sedoheptulose 7-phosphate isomerase
VKKYNDLLKDYYSNPLDIEKAVELIIEKIINGKSIWVIGNGGSASTAEHFEIDLMFIKQDSIENKIKVTALTSNSAVITAIANDKGYEYIFSSQLERKAQKGDLCIIISASGNSKNLVEANKVCKTIGIQTLTILGFDGGKLLKTSDVSLHFKSEYGQYGVVEDVHLSICHQISQAVLVEIKNIK